MDVMKELSPLQLSAVCSNLSKACEKQTLAEQSALFSQLSEYYKSISKQEEGREFQDIVSLVLKDLEAYPKAADAAREDSDRGALRASVWGEKVTKLLKSLLARYEKQKDALLENTSVYVCEICGFIFVGDVPPEICPICKVPSFKLTKIEREVM